MNNLNLDGLLVDLALREAPELPASFAQNVLREIRLRQHRAENAQPWFVWLLHAWLQPTTFALALVVAVAIGAALPLTFRSADDSRAISGLDLNVFSSISPHAPSGLLAKIQ